MKKGKLSVLAVAAVGACCCFAAVGCANKEDNSHTHEYGDWAITSYPTQDDGGKISRTCTANDGGVETLDIPKLSDTTFWSEQTTPAGHGTPGQSVYTNAEYSIEYTVVIPAQDHVWGAWDFVAGKKPTKEEGGKISRKCSAEDGGEETKDVPKLTDSTFWTAGALTEPGHTTDGHQAFTNATYNLSVTVTALATGHTYGKWAFADGHAATVAAGGKLVRECSADDDGIEELNVPALGDATFWKKTTITADYNTAGYDVYAPKNADIEFETRVKTADKLVTPYDNKTYYALAYQIASASNLDRAVNINSSWNKATLALGGENGNVGIGQAYPYRNMLTTVEMVDAAIGKVKVSMIEVVDGTSAEPVILPGATVKEYVGYVNMDSDDDSYGIIVYQNENNDYMLLTPHTYVEESNTYDDDGEITGTIQHLCGYHAGTVASSWTFADDNGFSCKGLAVSYKYGAEADNVVNFYLEEDAVTNFRVYFGAKFDSKKDNSGSAVAADRVFSSKAVYIKTADGQVVNAFGHNGTVTNKLDGHEGEYTGTLDEGSTPITLKVDGVGGFTDMIDSRYEIAAKGSSYTLDAYIGGSYYEITLDSAGSFTAVKPMVTITFEMGDGHEPEDPIQLNKNITVEVSNLEVEGFMGWYFDALYNRPVPSEFTPTEDITMYARWSTTFIEFQVEADGDPIRVYYVDGAKLGDLVPDSVVTNDPEKQRYLVGWFTAAEGGNQISNNAALYAEDSGFKIYAHWAAIPNYSGTYYGSEIWGNTSGNYGNKNITIDESNAMTGSKSGTIKSYDPSTQEVVFTASGKDYSAWYDADNGIFVLNDTNNTYMTADIYVMSKYNTAQNSKLSAFYGIQTAPPVGSGQSSRGFYAHVVTMPISATQSADVLFYNNRIYVGVTMTNTKGETLTVDAIQNSKDVIVKDKLGNTVFAVSSTGETFKKQTSTVDLDEYYGNYAVGSKTVALDGTGGMTITDGADTVSGRYVLVSMLGGDLTFDLFVQEEDVVTEHFVFTVPRTGNKTLVKETVTLTDGTLGGTFNINTKVALELPTPTNPDNTKIFRGWYTDALCRVPVVLTDGKYTMTDSETLYSKWEQKVTLTVHYNSATAAGAPDDEVIELAYGELAEMEKPVSSMKFMGWFTTPEFGADSAWTPDMPLYGDTTIYAKWSPAPAFYKTYVGVMEINGTTANGSTSAYNGWTSPKFSIDADGVGSLINSAYPINKDITITGYDDANGTLIFNLGTNKYRGIVDKNTGVLIVSKTAGESADIKEVWFFAPFDNVGKNDSYSSSYWNGGRTRAIQFTSNDTTYSYFINDNVIYTGVTFKTAATGGENIAAKDCFGARELYVTATGYSLHVGFNGTTMVEEDGYVGTYADSGSFGSVVINGVGSVTINGKAGYYSQIVDDKLTTTIDGSYYEVSVNKTDKTCTVVAPTATATFVFDGEHATAELNDVAVTTNVPTTLSTNVSFQMPTITPALGYQFLGWYEDAEYTKAITQYTFTTAGAAKTFYAKVEAMPAWASKETADAVSFNTDGLSVINGETTALNKKYWAKFVVAEDGYYTFYAPTATRVGGTITHANYARYSVIKEDGTKAADRSTNLSFGSSVSKFALAAGMYYVETHLGGVVTDSTINYDCYGTFTINIVRNTTTAYTVGTQLTAITPLFDGKISKIYSVTLEAGKTYSITVTNANDNSFEKAAFYTDEACSTQLKYNGAHVRIAQWSTSPSAKTFEVTETGTYYFTLSDKQLDFILEEVAA